MKRLILYLLFSASFLFSFAQSAEGRYVSRMTRDGVLFFINPQKLNILSEIKKFEYDVTLLTWCDSATVNFTFESPQMSIPTDLKILCGNDTLECHSFSPLFVDIKKNHFQVRITSKFPVHQLYELYKSPDPLKFEFLQDDIVRSATYKNRAWLRDKKRIIDIFQLYFLSK